MTKMLPSMSSPCVTVFKSRQIEMGTKYRCLVLSQRTGRNKWFKELIGGSLGEEAVCREGMAQRKHCGC